MSDVVGAGPAGKNYAPQTTAFSFLKGKKICVSGGTGFLGQHLLPLLETCGAKLTCLVRPSSRTASLPDSARVVVCNLATGSGLDSALAGQDIFIHMSSLLFGLGWQDYLRANVTACLNLRSALEKCPAGPQKIIYVSSLAAAGPCAATPGVDERAIPAPVSAYGWSKLFCENIFRASYGRHLAILRPPIIYGSGDRGLLPMFKSAKQGFGASPGAFRKFPVSVIHADDAARAVLYACKAEAAGVYHLNDGSEHDMDGFCRAMGRALGRDSMRVAHVPLPLMGMAAVFGSAFGIVRRRLCDLSGRSAPRPPEWNMDKYREARQCGWLADARHIEKELGFVPQVSLTDGMEEAVAGYHARGWL